MDRSIRTNEVQQTPVQSPPPRRESKQAKTAYKESPNSRMRERKAWCGYRTLRKPPTTKSTRWPQLTSGTRSSNADDQLCFGDAFFARTFAAQVSHKIELLPDSPNYKQVGSIPDFFDGIKLYFTILCIARCWLSVCLCFMASV